MKPKKLVFIGIVGMSPQVITETLYALMVQQKKTVSEIVLLTTAEGKAKLVELDFVSQLKSMCKAYNLECPKFELEKDVLVAKEETVELSDIRTDRDNQLFPNMIMDLIRNKTNDNNTRLHCSIAGGRKTMSIAMAYALSLFGRKDDKLSHVLVSKEFENSKKFYPENKSEDKQIVLANVPFVRLREKLPLLKEYPRATYTEFVSLTQQEINNMVVLPQLIVDRSNHTIEIAGKKITLPPFNFAVYNFFLEKGTFVRGEKYLNQKDAELLWKIYNQYAVSKGHIEKAKATWFKNQRVEIGVLVKSISQIKRRMRSTFTDFPWIDNYIISTRGTYGVKEYGILIEKSKIISK